MIENCWEGLEVWEEEGRILEKEKRRGREGPSIWKGSIAARFWVLRWREKFGGRGEEASKGIWLHLLIWGGGAERGKGRGEERWVEMTRECSDRRERDGISSISVRLSLPSYCYQAPPSLNFNNSCANPISSPLTRNRWRKQGTNSSKQGRSTLLPPSLVLSDFTKTSFSYLRERRDGKRSSLLDRKEWREERRGKWLSPRVWLIVQEWDGASFLEKFRERCVIEL